MELVLVADNAEYQAAGSLDAVHHQLKDLANIINAVRTLSVMAARNVLNFPVVTFILLEVVVVFSASNNLSCLVG